ncbi:MAG: hypothetical protein Q8R08_00115 [bacterium]|nr:hypothetical protein [bacterium]
MIQIQAKVLGELKGCKSFGFHLDTKIKEQKGFCWNSPLEQMAQSRMTADIRSILEQFQTLPCDVDIETGVREGTSYATGMIYAYDQYSMDFAQAILQSADHLAFGFLRQFPGSSFAFGFSQTVTITRVDR